MFVFLSQSLLCFQCIHCSVGCNTRNRIRQRNNISFWVALKLIELPRRAAFKSASFVLSRHETMLCSALAWATHNDGHFSKNRGDAARSYPGSGVPKSHGNCLLVPGVHWQSLSSSIISARSLIVATGLLRLYISTMPHTG